MMNTNFLHNKRNNPRIDCPLGVSLADCLGIHHGTAINTSQGGALIDAPSKYKEGDTIYIQFQTDLADLPVVAARVVRREPAFFGSRALLGVEFAEPSPSLVDIVKLEKGLRLGASY